MSPARQSSRRAFSLVEVTLALGVLAFAFLALLGMLPVGLHGFREALDRTVTAQIAQKLLTEAQQTPFANLASLDGERYYTDEGGTATASGFIYNARVSVAAAGTSVPANGAVAVPPLRTVTVRIAKNMTVQAMLDAGREHELVERSFLVADVGL